MDIVHASFSPSPEQLADAVALINAFDAAADAGKGAFTYKNKMIDMPTVLQMRNQVTFARNAGLL